jgi:tetratricopeptide (TPR) repeat protein
MPKKKPEGTNPLPPQEITETDDSTLSQKNEGDAPESIVKPRKTRKKATVVEASPVEVKDEGVETSLETEPVLKKRKHGGWVVLGILGMLTIAFIGAFIGYESAINLRQAEQQNRVLVLATTQYELSLQDFAKGNLDNAKRRLEYVIQVYPTYPGAANKLAEVMVAMAQNNQTPIASTPIPVVEATKDTRGEVAIFAQAQQQLITKDWQNLFNSVNSLRDLDPAYEAIKVDGMYYLALRNVGMTNITSGNLEQGIYNFSVARQIAPIDLEADGLQRAAEEYIDGGANWGVNWQIAVNNFELLYQNYPFLSDFNGVTSKQRYAESLEGLGDTYEVTYDWCHAKDQYSLSASIMTLQGVSDKLSQAEAYCSNPPPTPTPITTPTPTPVAPTP